MGRGAKGEQRSRGRAEEWAVSSKVFAFSLLPCSHLLCFSGRETLSQSPGLRGPPLRVGAHVGEGQGSRSWSSGSLRRPWAVPGRGSRTTVWSCGGNGRGEGGVSRSQCPLGNAALQWHSHPDRIPEAGAKSLCSGSSPPPSSQRALQERVLGLTFGEFPRESCITNKTGKGNGGKMKHRLA